MEPLGDRVIVIWRDVEQERLRAVELPRGSIGN
jgi:hypothetical protein